MQNVYIREYMSLFVAVHKWKPEEFPAIMKEAMVLFTAVREGKLPTGIELCSTYMRDNGAFCVWVAPDQAILEQLFDQHAPVMKKGTELVPVVQSYPPTMEYVLFLWQTMLAQAAPK